MNIFPSIGQYIRHYPLSSLEILVIWIVCMIPVPETPLSDVAFMDKWTHFVMYGSLTLVIWCEYMYQHKWLKKDSHRFQVHWTPFLSSSILCLVIMGGLIELAQAYLTTCRSGEWLDFFCDSLGVLLGACIGYTIMIILRRKK